MAFRINPFHQLLWRTPEELQVGTGPKARVLTAVTEAQEKFIDALYFGVPESQLAALAKQARLPAQDAAGLLDQLDGMLLLAGEPCDFDGIRPAGAEMARAGLNLDDSPSRPMARRSRSSVHIDVLDATGLTLLLALAAAGVGVFTSRDSGKVTADDVASNTYPKALLGQSRFAAAKLILDSSQRTARMHYTNRTNDKKTARVDLAILVHQQVTPPTEVAQWRSMGVPVIEVRYQPDGFELSPVLPPGEGCLICRDHHRQDSDASHLAVSAQLLGSDLRFDDAASRLMATGLATCKVLEHLDLRDSSKFGYRFWTSDRAGVLGPTRLEIENWQAHDSCGCRLDGSQVSLASESVPVAENAILPHSN